MFCLRKISTFFCSESQGRVVFCCIFVGGVGGCVPAQNDAEGESERGG